VFGVFFCWGSIGSILVKLELSEDLVLRGDGCAKIGEGSSSGVRECKDRGALRGERGVGVKLK